MVTQLRESSAGWDNRNGVNVQTGTESSFAQWLTTFKAANLDEHGRQLPSDLSALKRAALELRGSIPLSGPIHTDLPVVRKTKADQPPLVTTEPRVGRVELRAVGAGFAKDLQVVLALRKPEDDYRAEPTRSFDPLAAAKESLRASRVEIIPLESGDLSQVDQILKPGVLEGINAQVGTIEGQAREYLAWGQ